MTEFKKFAGVLAEKSGEIIRQYFRTSFSVEKKRDASPVTIADRKAEDVMRELIMKEFPQHGIIGEEADNHQPEAEYKWVLDPIDGTLNFICGGWMFGTLIALLKGNEPILGVIHQPVLKELVVGDNFNTTFNGENVRVRRCDSISDAILLTTDPYLVKQYQNFETFEKLRQSVRIYRGWGDCYGYLLLATGQVDIMLDPIMNFWDIMALIPVVRGAGGVITDYQGQNPVNGTSIIACGENIHPTVVSMLDP